MIPSLRVQGHLAFAALTVLAAVFYRERAAFADMAFQTVLMCGEGTFQVMVNRFGVVLVQALPLLAIRLEAPLWVVSLLYSVSFPLLFWAVYALVVQVLRQEALGLTSVLFFTLMVYDAFYWPSSEQQQGLAFLLLFFAFVQRYPALKPAWTLWVAVLAVPVLAYYHPLVFVPFYFLWAFYRLRDARCGGLRYDGLAVYMAIVLVFKAQFSGNWYDDDKYRTFRENLSRLFPDYFHLPAHGQFADWCLAHWYFLPLLWGFVTVFYALRRQWKPLLLMWIFGLGHVMLLHIAAVEHPYRFYAEVNYMPLVIYAALPLWHDVAPATRNPIWLRVGLAVLLLWRICAIALHHRPYAERMVCLERIATEGRQRTGSSRLLLPETPALKDTLIITWSVPYETLVLTAMSHPDSAKTLLVRTDFSAFEAEINREDVLLSDFGVRRDTMLNPLYFRLPPGPYRFVEQ